MSPMGMPVRLTSSFAKGSPSPAPFLRSFLAALARAAHAGDRVALAQRLQYLQGLLGLQYGAEGPSGGC